MGKRSKLVDKTSKVDMDGMVQKKPKEKRRNSEKRKEKSRDAARCRRSKESEIFADLANTLPIPTAVTNQMDKASVMRLAIAYLKIRQILGADAFKSEDDAESLDTLLMKALDGFLLVLSSEGDIVYVSDCIAQHLGLSQMDLLGQPLFDYSHPCDHEELRETLSIKADVKPESLSKSFFLRMKCTLTNKGRSVNLKSATYKVIHFTGHVIQPKSMLTKDSEEHSLVLIGEPIPHPSRNDVHLDERTFITKHSMDLKFTSVDKKVTEYFGYSPLELEGKSLLEFHHILDGESVGKTFKILMSKGQAETGCYRFLAKNGGYVWVESQATVVYGQKDGKPQHVVCTHYVLSGIEHPGEILSLSQVSGRAESVAVGKENHAPRVKRPLVADGKRPGLPCPPVPSEKVLPKMPFVEVDLPKANTANIFVPRTEGMDAGFLGFDEANECFTMLKEEPDDLTYLAPGAGDSCIPLAVPTFLPFDSLIEMKDMENIEKDFECLPLTAFEFPGFDMLEPTDSGIGFDEPPDGAFKRKSITESFFTSKPGSSTEQKTRYSPVSDEESRTAESPFGALASAVRNKGDLLDLVGEDRGIKRKQIDVNHRYQPMYSALTLDDAPNARGPVLKDIPLFASKGDQSPISPGMTEHRVDDTKKCDMLKTQFGISSKLDMKDKSKSKSIAGYSNESSPVMSNLTDDEEDMEHRAPMISMCDEVPFVMTMWDLPALDDLDPFATDVVKTMPVIPKPLKPRIDRPIQMDPQPHFEPQPATPMDRRNSLDKLTNSSLFSLLSGPKPPPTGRVFEEPGTRPPFEKMIPARPPTWRGVEPIIPNPKKTKVSEPELPTRKDYVDTALGRLLLTNGAKPPPSQVLQVPKEVVEYDYHNQPRLTGGGPNSLPVNQRRDSVLLNLLVSGVDRKEGYICPPSLRDKDADKRDGYNMQIPRVSQIQDRVISQGSMRTVVKIPQRLPKQFNTTVTES